MEPVRIDGEQIFLRSITLEDSEQIIRWRNSEEVRKYFIIQTDLTMEAQERWIRTMVETGKVAQFIICVRESGREIGSVNLKDIDPQNKRAEYGIYIGEPDCKGRGYGTEAAKLMTEYGFRELGLHKIYLLVSPDNMRAKKSYEKAGFVEEAVLKEEVFADGRYHDMIRMAIFSKAAQGDH